MKTGTLGEFLRRLRERADAEAGRDLTDDELLARFRDRGEEAAPWTASYSAIGRRFAAWRFRPTVTYPAARTKRDSLGLAETVTWQEVKAWWHRA
jgi:hypothetical protein